MIATDWENIFTKDKSDKGLLFKIHKESLKCNNKKTNSPILKMAKDLNSHSTKEDKQAANTHMKNGAPRMSPRSWKLKQQTTTKQLLQQPKPGTLMTWNAGKDVEQQELSFTVGRNEGKVVRFRRPPGSFLQNFNIFLPHDPTSSLIFT